MGFEHPAIAGKYGRWVALPFGASQSPAISCNVTSSAADIFNRQFKPLNIRAKCTVYVDDFFVVADSHSHLQLAFDIMDRVGKELGLEWNLDKDKGRDRPLQSLELLGIIINAVEEKLFLPDDKRIAYRSIVHELQP